LSIFYATGINFLVLLQLVLQIIMKTDKKTEKTNIANATSKKDCKKKAVKIAGGCLTFFVLIMVLLAFFVFRLHTFLSVTKQCDADILVVEGWTPDYVHEHAASLYFENNYRYIFVPGVPLEKGSYLIEFENYAEVGKETLIALGIPEEKIISIPVLDIQKDRTYASAKHIKEWLLQNSVSAEGINIVTLDAHSRRSLFLYQKAFGTKKNIGIIAVPDKRFSAKKWWKTSNGFRSVTHEFIAWFYAVFFFVAD